MRNETTETSRRFLVVRTDRIGDVVLSIPVLTALKLAYPHSHVAVLVRSEIYEVVSGHPDVDEILIDEERTTHRGIRGALRLARTLRLRSFDTVVMLHPTLRLAFIVMLARIRLRVGTAYRAYSILFNKKVYHHRKRSNQHELDLNLELVSAIGAKLNSVEFKFHTPDQAIRKADQLIDELGISPKKKLVILHPGSGGSALDWPVEKFAKLSDRLIEEAGVAVVITGSPQEGDLIDALMRTSRQKPFRLDGRTNLKELTALLLRADLLVANSTGPLHLAVAVGTDVIGIYCPVEPCLPQRWGPYGRIESVIMPKVDVCKKCKGPRCVHFDCMETIGVDRVFDIAIKKLLKSN